VWEKLKGVTGRLDKPALLKSIALMLMSWAALPIVYWLLVRKKGSVKEVKNVLGKSGCENPKREMEMVVNEDVKNPME
jgi:hypothetical protein